MGTTLAIIVVIVVVLAAGFLRDSLRTEAVNRWCRAHAFAFVPKPDHDRDRLIAWAERFRPYNASHWGIVLRGEPAGVDTTIAEHREKRPSSPERWHTLVVTRVPGQRLDGVRITRAPSQAGRRVIDAMTAPARELRDRLGIEVTAPPVVHPVGQGRWAVELVKEDALAFWSSAPQAAALDAWPHDIELAAVDDLVLVRAPGLIAARRLDDLLASADAARTFFAQAAARMAAQGSAPVTARQT